MASVAPTLKPSICAEKEYLNAVFVQAVHEVMEVQYQELAALARGEFALDRFDLALKLARQKRDALKKSYLTHIRAHGCCPSH